MSVAHKVCHAHPAASPPLRHPSHGTYGDALATLVVDHGYGENLLNVHLTNPGYDDQGIAWFDFGNAFYTYYSFFQAAPWSKASGVTVVSVDLPATAAADDSAAVTGAGGVTVYGARPAIAGDVTGSSVDPSVAGDCECSPMSGWCQNGPECPRWHGGSVSS